MTDNREGTAPFEKLARIAHDEVTTVLAALPEKIRAHVEAVPIFCEPFPDAADRASGIEPDTLGYFDEGSPDTPTPRIRLWLENLWDEAEGDERTFRDEVRVTLLHEIGHLLGWDEDDVDARGLG